MTASLLAIGLVAVAGIFSYSARANITTQQRTTATVLLHEKMEQFKSTPLTDSMWTAGGRLDPRAPASGYFEYLEIDSSGGVSISTTDSDLPYLRLWQITGTVPRSVTVAVYAQKSGLTGRPSELIRATAITGHSF